MIYYTTANVSVNDLNDLLDSYSVIAKSDVATLVSYFTKSESLTYTYGNYEESALRYI